MPQHPRWVILQEGSGVLSCAAVLRRRPAAMRHGPFARHTPGQRQQ
ncbi:hypothetical protein DA2_3378 [Desulfovibrio sp. A2]|nr:hypothetical protein DA2_3378 [Desulfovibrio sp. A2]